MVIFGFDAAQFAPVKMQSGQESLCIQAAGFAFLLWCHERQQIAALRIEIDEQRTAGQVAEITESDYFRQLEAKADQLRTGMG